MKSIKSMFVILALVLFTGAVFATGNLNVQVMPVEKKKVFVRASNDQQSRYEIELRNPKGVIVYYKRTVSPVETYVKSYNLSGLADGIYTLTVKANDEKMENTLVISDGLVSVAGQRKEVEPFFALKGNRLELSWLNFANENSSIQVYENNKLIFEKPLNRDFTINYAFDFSGLERGNYNAVLLTDNNSFEYPVVKR